MSAAQFTVTLPEVRTADFRLSAAKAMRNWGGRYIETLTSQRMSGRPGTNRRTGNLARGWNSTVTVEGGDTVLRVWVAGPGATYAAMQEFGKDRLTPRKSKYLWIPIAGNVTATGVARISPREAIARGGFHRNGVFFGAPLVKGGRKGMGPHIVPLFALKRSVRIPARLGARAHFAAKQTDLFLAILSAGKVLS